MTINLPSIGNMMSDAWDIIHGPRRNNDMRQIDPETEILVTCGGTEAMMSAMMTVCNPGDKVIVFSPFYENYSADAILSGADPIFVPLVPPTFDFDRIVYLGNIALKGVAQESALKMLELTAGKVATMYDSQLGFRHGPKSIINDTPLTVAYLSDDAYRRQYELDLIKEMSGQRKGNKIVAESSVSILGIDKSTTAEGTYELIKYDDGDLEIKIDFEEETDLFKDGTYAYEEGDGYIKIGVIKYEKED